jgi:hypothetical protein
MEHSLKEEEDDEAFLRKIIFPEEDRHLFRATPWNGGYRWFRSPNVVPLEQWRRKRDYGSNSETLVG